MASPCRVMIGVGSTLISDEATEVQPALLVTVTVYVAPGTGGVIVTD